MPPEQPGTAASPARTVEAEPAAPADERDEEDLPREGSGHGVARRRLIVGAVLAALAIVGGSTAAIVQGVQRAVDDAATEALTAVAVDYLGAIAEGRGDAATAMVPVDGPARLLTDAARAAAARIQECGVEAVELDGDSATVVVDFRSGQRRVERRLDAVRQDGTWRLTTSLAERVVLEESVIGPLPRLLDMEIGRDGGTLLYPGMYRTEAIEHGFVQISPVTLVVDGDPRTTVDFQSLGWTVAWSAPTDVLDGAPERALSHATACQSAGSCAVPPGALLGACA